MNLAKLEIQKKDMLYIVVTVIILAGVFILGYRQLNPAGGASAGVTVEVVQPIGSSFNSAAVDYIQDDEKSKNFVVPIDLGTGVGTTTPFGQL